MIATERCVKNLMVCFYNDIKTVVGVRAIVDFGVLKHACNC